jgi:Uma2 family endonuclease
MTVADKPHPLLSVEDYLAYEQQSEIKHEYRAGMTVAMGGASRAHGLIAASLLGLLQPYVRHKGCELFMADMKVRIDYEGDSWFYYPDLVLSCDPGDHDPLCVRNPCLLVEVLSASTEHTDTREKLLAYRLLPSLREYLLLRQDAAQAYLYQRGDEGGWQHHAFSTPDERLPLRCVDGQPSLREIYADIPALLT